MKRFEEGSQRQEFYSEFIPNWVRGTEHFNAQQFWKAHEAWEIGWLRLPQKEKTHIQILIQGAGVFYLIEKGRQRGAHSLAKAALTKFQWLGEQGGVDEIFPRIELPGLEQVLQEFVQKQIVPFKNPLRARLLLSPV